MESHEAVAAPKDPAAATTGAISARLAIADDDGILLGLTGHQPRERIRCAALRWASLVHEVSDDGQDQTEDAASESGATKACFVISPIGEPGTLTAKRANEALRYLIRPVAKDCGYDAKRADEDTRPGIITNHVIQRVADADLIVADLTDYNPNVFYELAIRHALQRPLVQLMARGEDLPFDVARMRTVFSTSTTSTQSTRRSGTRRPHSRPGRRPGSGANASEHRA